MKKTILLLVIPLCACASLVSSPLQTISVATSQPGATCELSNDKGSWTIPSTPGHVVVSRSQSPLTVMCKAADGASGGITMSAGANSQYANNILTHGGLIGQSYDRSTGAAFEYPAMLTVPIK